MMKGLAHILRKPFLLAMAKGFLVVHQYCEVTESIRVIVEPTYIPERSRPDGHYFFYAYTIRVENNSDYAIQLLKRYWIIRDGHGHEERIYGDGVVGERPIIRPGKHFQYTSFCPLETPTGNMRGRFEMIDEYKNNFQVNIPLFFLRPPETFH